MADLFISYAKPDRSLATELADELRGRGFSVWIDQGGIGGAKNWSAEIVEAINRCSTLLILLSPDSIASHNVAKELQLASEKRKNILPIVVEKVTLPSVFEYPLVGLQRVYYHDRPAIFNALQLLSGAIVATEQLLPAIVPTANDTSIRVAVLPFDDLSPKHDNQWFADGMMDELIATLGHLDNMKVPPRSDVLHYRDRHEKSRVIAAELGVRYIIEGAVRKAGKKIRINTALIDTHQSGQLWGDQFDGSFHDVFAFQESVSRHITDALKLQLSPQEEKQIEARPTENAEAYELYLKGRHEQYYFTKESYLRALDLYEQAAKLDPKFDLAYIGIASVCCVYYRDYSSDQRWLDRAEQAAVKAEEISGVVSRTISMRGTIDWLRSDDDEAINKLSKAGELDSQNDSAFNVLGGIYMVHKRYAEAANAFEKIIQYKESTPAYFNFLNALYDGKEYAKLRKMALKALPIFERSIKLDSKDQNLTAVLRCFVLFWAGKILEAEVEAEKLSSRADISGVALYNLSCVFNVIGKPEQSIPIMRLAIKKGFRSIVGIHNFEFTHPNPSLENELKNVIAELEDLIKSENVLHQNGSME